MPRIPLPGVDRDYQELESRVTSGELAEDDLNDAGRLTLALGRGEARLEDLNDEGRALLGASGLAITEAIRKKAPPITPAMKAEVGQIGRETGKPRPLPTEVGPTLGGAEMHRTEPPKPTPPPLPPSDPIAPGFPIPAAGPVLGDAAAHTADFSQSERIDPNRTRRHFTAGVLDTLGSGFRSGQALIPRAVEGLVRTPEEREAQEAQARDQRARMGRPREPFMVPEAELEERRRRAEAPTTPAPGEPELRPDPAAARARAATKAVTDPLDRWATNLEQIAKDVAPEDPTFRDRVVRAFASSATLLLPALGTAKTAEAVARVSPKLARAIAAITEGGLESLVEAGSTYQEALKRTGNVDAATKAAVRTFGANLVLLRSTQRFSPFTATGPQPTRALKVAGVEGAEEAAQEVAGEGSQGRLPTAAQLGEAALLGGLVGGVAGSVIPGAPKEGPPGPLPDREEQLRQHLQRATPGRLEGFRFHPDPVVSRVARSLLEERGLLAPEPSRVVKPTESVPLTTPPISSRPRVEPRDEMPDVLAQPAPTIVPEDSLPEDTPATPPTVPETPDTIAAKLDLFRQGQKPAVLVPTEQRRQIPEAFKKGKGTGFVTLPDGQVLIFRPDAIRPLSGGLRGTAFRDWILAEFAAGRGGDILGYGVAEKPVPGEPATLVETRDAEGGEVVTQVVPPESTAPAVAAGERMTPAGGTVAVTPPDQAEPRAQEILAEREGTTETTEGRGEWVFTRFLTADPERFQFRRDADAETGATKKKRKKYDPAKGEPLLVWTDPADGKTYIVDGHHRFESAQQQGLERVRVEQLEAESAEQAKAIGAARNLAQGKAEPEEVQEAVEEAADAGTPVPAEEMPAAPAERPAGTGSLQGLREQLAEVQRRLATWVDQRAKAIERIVTADHPDRPRATLEKIDAEIVALNQRERELGRIIARIERQQAEARAEPVLTPDEQAQLTEAFTAWRENRAYLDNAGHYHLRSSVPTPTHKPRGPIAPWSRLVKRVYPDNAAFHEAATAAKPGGDRGTLDAVTPAGGPGSPDPTRPTPPEPVGGIDEAALRAQLGPGDRSRLPSEVPGLRAEMPALADYTDARAYREWLGEGTPYWQRDIYQAATAGRAIPIFRAVPTGVATIHPGAYVSQSRAYATRHLADVLRGEGHVIEATATARELLPVNPNEFWYAPESADRPSPSASPPTGEAPPTGAAGVPLVPESPDSLQRAERGATELLATIQHELQDAQKDLRGRRRGSKAWSDAQATVQRVEARRLPAELLQTKMRALQAAQRADAVGRGLAPVAQGASGLAHSLDGEIRRLSAELVQAVAQARQHVIREYQGRPGHAEQTQAVELWKAVQRDAERLMGLVEERTRAELATPVPGDTAEAVYRRGQQAVRATPGDAATTLRYAQVLEGVAAVLRARGVEADGRGLANTWHNTLVQMSPETPLATVVRALEQDAAGRLVAARTSYGPTGRDLYRGELDTEADLRGRTTPTTRAEWATRAEHLDRHMAPTGAGGMRLADRLDRRRALAADWFRMADQLEALHVALAVEQAAPPIVRVTPENTIISEATAGAAPVWEALREDAGRLRAVGDELERQARAQHHEAVERATAPSLDEVRARAQHPPQADQDARRLWTEASERDAVQLAVLDPETLTRWLESGEPGELTKAGAATAKALGPERAIAAAQVLTSEDGLVLRYAPTPYRLTRTANQGGRLLVGPIGQRPAWTNGHLLDVGELPKGLRPRPPADPPGPMPEGALKLIASAVKGPLVPVTPLARWARAGTNARPHLFLRRDDGGLVAVDTHYFDHLATAHPTATLVQGGSRDASGDYLQPLVFREGPQVVGLLMPLRTAGAVPPGVQALAETDPPAAPTPARRGGRATSPAYAPQQAELGGLPRKPVYEMTAEEFDAWQAGAGTEFQRIGPPGSPSPWSAEQEREAYRARVSQAPVVGRLGTRLLDSTRDGLALQEIAALAQEPAVSAMADAAARAFGRLRTRLTLHDARYGAARFGGLAIDGTYFGVHVPVSVTGTLRPVIHLNAFARIDQLVQAGLDADAAIGPVAHAIAQHLVDTLTHELTHQIVPRDADPLFEPALDETRRRATLERTQATTTLRAWLEANDGDAFRVLARLARGLRGHPATRASIFLDAEFLPATPPLEPGGHPGGIDPGGAGGARPGNNLRADRAAPSAPLADPAALRGGRARHHAAVRLALRTGRLDPARAEALGHFRAYPDLAAEFGRAPASADPAGPAPPQSNEPASPGYHPPGAPGAPPPTQVKAREAIIDALSVSLGRPIRKGHFRQKALGIFKVGPEVVRTKHTNDLHTVAHEVGHLLQTYLFPESVVGAGMAASLSARPLRQWARELIPLAYPGAKGKLIEGFAEFVRYYLTEPAVAQERAPTLFPAFEARLAQQDPLIRDGLLQFRADVAAWQQAGWRGRGRALISYDSGRLQFPGWRRTWDQLYAAAWDRLHPINMAIRHLEERRPLRPDDNPYILARLTRGDFGKAEAFLKYGTFDFHTRQRTGEPLQAILQDVERLNATQGTDLNDWDSYLVARRTLELAARPGLVTTPGVGSQPPSSPSGMTVPDAQRWVDNYPDYAPLAERFTAYHDRLLQFVAESGFFDATALAHIRQLNQSYVPFQRVMDDWTASGGRGMGGRRFANLPQAVKRLTGSARQIISPLESTLQNTYHLISLAERNRVLTAMVDLVEETQAHGVVMDRVPWPQQPIRLPMAELVKVLQQHGLSLDPDLSPEQLEQAAAEIATIFKPTAFLPQGDNLVYVWRQGERQAWQVMDPMLYDALMNLGPETTKVTVPLLGPMARIFRKGVTLNPAYFLGRNVPRDQLTALVQSETGYVPFVDWGRGMVDALGGTEAIRARYAEWLASGGAHAGLVGLDRATMQKTQAELMRTGIQGAIGLPSPKEFRAHPFRTTMGWALSPFHLLEVASRATEEASRLREFARARAQGLGPTEAAFLSREVTQDFAKQGYVNAAINVVVPFWSAWWGGWDKMARTAWAHPVRMALYMASLATVSILLYLANRDDERYREIPQAIRDTNWIFLPDEGPPVKLVKPFDYGVLASLPERFLEWLDQRDRSLLDMLGGTLLQSLTHNVVPQGVIGPVENWANWSFFHGRPIVPGRFQRLAPEYQEPRGTSPTVAGVARAMPDVAPEMVRSPAQLQHLLRSYFGATGQLATKLADLAFTQAGLIEPSPAAPPPRIEDLPMIGEFFVRYPAANAASLTRFYDRWEKAQEAHRTYMFLVRSQRPTEAKAFVEAHREVLRDYFRLKPTAQGERGVPGLLQLRQKAEGILNGPGDPEQKRQRVDALYLTMIRRARQALTNAVPVTEGGS